jgi:serine protease AprX
MRSRSACSAALVVAGLSACESPTDPGLAACKASEVSHRRALPTGPVIIHFGREIDLPTRAAIGRRGRHALTEALRRDALSAQDRAVALIRGRGFEPKAQLWMVNAIAATLPDALLEEIAQLPEVERIEPDLEITVPVTVTTPATTAPVAWNLSAIRAPELWATGKRGAGSVVAMVDTGVDVEHPDLASAWRSTAGWYDPYGEHATPYDGNGHGTQVAGLVVGGDTSGEPIGVAPDARWIGSRFLDDSGHGSVSGIHRALQWILDPDGDATTDDAADIVVVSWGYAYLINNCYLELEVDIATLRAAQVATVVAAGNAGPYGASSISPANNPSAFAAGAVDESLAVLDSSSRGPDACTHSIFPELVAPGANVRTADLTQRGQFPGSYTFGTGTSFAAPHIAGAMALLRGAHPSATVTQLEDALTTTAKDLTATGADNDSGFGLPDIVAAEARLAVLVSTGNCTDADGDGYVRELGCGTGVDCSDTDAGIHPDACDVPNDSIDQDCDGTDRVSGTCCAS